MLSVTAANDVIVPAKAVTINGHRVTKGKALVWLTTYTCQWSLEGSTLAITDCSPAKARWDASDGNITVSYAAPGSPTYVLK